MEYRVLEELKAIVGPENLVSNRVGMMAYAYDATGTSHLPDVVVFPTEREHVVEIMKISHREKIPVTPRGAGTNLSGGSVPMGGGILLNMTKMNRILEVDTKNMVAVVEPGVVNNHLQVELGKEGFFYAPDPASQQVCTMGGSVAECAGGPKCLRYGVVRDHLLGLEMVMPDGEVLETGGRLPSIRPSYDLTQLFCGSEGTMGIMTKITVRIVRKQEKVTTLLAIYDRLLDAGQTVSEIIAAGILPLTLELMDQTLIGAVENYMKIGLPTDAAAILIIEVEGFEESLSRQAEMVVDICKRNKVKDLKVAGNEAERAEIWKARKSTIGAVSRIKPSFVLQDVTVPRNRLIHIFNRIDEISKEQDIQIGMLAHLGDGNLHPIILYDPRVEREVKAMEAAAKEVFRAALDFNGVLSGEHGIGVKKKEYMPWLFTQPTLDVMEKVKQVFDPGGTLNPEKIFPVSEGDGVEEKEVVV